MSVSNFILAIEELLADREDINGQIRDTFKEAKNEGYDNKIMRKVIALRKMDAEDRLEQDILTDRYLKELDNVDS